MKSAATVQKSDCRRSDGKLFGWPRGRCVECGALCGVPHQTDCSHARSAAQRRDIWRDPAAARERLRESTRSTARPCQCDAPRCEREGCQDKPTLLPAIRQEFTVHECAECGHIEGESPQAGCCPRCGIKSDALPLKVKRV